MRFRTLMRLLAALTLVILSVAPSLAANLTGTVVNSSSVSTGRIYVSLSGWPSGFGVSIAAPGSFTIRGVPDGYYQLQGFRDSNSDGVYSSTEAAGESTVVIAEGVAVYGAPVLQLFDPLQPTTPEAAPSLKVSPGNGAVLVSWEYPTNMYGAVEADSFNIEWSSDGFATPGSSVAVASLLNDSGTGEGKYILNGLTNGTTYSFRVRSKIGSQSAVSQVVSAKVGPPAGGHTISGTVTLSGFTSAAGKPLYVVLWSDDDTDLSFVRYPSASSGMTFSILGVPDGTRGFYAFIDMNTNNLPDAGDYFISQQILVRVNGANIGGINVPLTAEDVSLAGVSTMNIIDGSDPSWYMLWFEMEGFRKRPVNFSITGPQVGTMDVNLLGEVGLAPPLQPNVGDSYTFTVTFLDGSTKSYVRQISAVYDDPATNIAPIGTIAGSPTAITWTPPAGFPSNGYALASIMSDSFSWDSKQYLSSVTSIPYTGTPLPNGQHSVMVQLCDIKWNCIAKSQGFTVAPGTLAPGSITVPANDADGSYTVSWAASASAGATYVLEESTNASFTAPTAINAGSALSAARTGRSPATAYYYRVKAVTSLGSSQWRTAAAPCRVSPAVPATITVPGSDSDGGYTVSWAASAGTGVGYTLEEATNGSFSAGFRVAYSGTGTSAAITGRTAAVTYYYRVKADKTGFISSAYRTAGNGCLIGAALPAAATPASITVPVADADGSYSLSWTASATAGASYELQEATNSTFGAGLRTLTPGTALSSAITGRSQNVTYYYRVRAVKTGYAPSAYRVAVNGCAVPGSAIVAAPASIVVPVADADGSYSVSWGASATLGATYLLQEATSPAFSAGLRTVYTGTALTAAITGRLQNVSYFYRVIASKPGLRNSAYRTAANSCAVPGSLTAATPAGIVVQPADADGIYSVSWSASATAGAIYLLQEATNSTFTLGLRNAYTGTALSAAITGRSQNVTYYYRVMAYKPGIKNSAYRTGATGCAVPGTYTTGTPASISVPASDADGSYSVSWGATATAGVTYQLQEATNSAFTTGFRTAYTGAALSSAITGRSPNVTYYYRVRATKPGYRDSGYRTAVNGCAVSGGTSKLTGTFYGPVNAQAVLQNNGANDLAISVPPFNTDPYNETPFTFPALLTNGTSYQVSLKTTPAGQTCSVYKGATGTLPVAANALKVGCEYTYDLVSRSTDNNAYGSYYNSSAPVVGGAAVAVGSTTEGYGEGRFVAFVSYAAGIDGSTGAKRQVFWRDRGTGETALISADASGVQGNGDSFAPAISADGLRVVFESYASNLVAGDTNAVRDVFLWSAQNRGAGAQRVSVGPSNVQANAESYQPTISGDGKVVAFSSGASNLTAGVSGTSTINVYRRDLTTGAVTLVSRNPAGTGVGGYHPALSENGNRLAFYSIAYTLVAGDTNSLWDIFVYDHAQAALSRVSLTGTGGERNQGDESSSRIVVPAISGNGRYVAFATTATNMVSGDTNAAQDVFVVDTQTGGVVRASVSGTGVQGNADSPVGQGERVSLSYDGAWVAFSTSSTNLGTGSGNVVMRNLTTGQTRVVSSQVSSSVGVPSMSRSGAYVVFGTGNQLDGRFSSSGLFARFTGVARSWLWPN